jgi:hypothetical protein
MKNSEDKLTIHYEDLNDYYDLYVNGLNVVASGTLYLTGDVGLLESRDPILVNGIDSGEVGMEYDFEKISDYCMRVDDFQPKGQGELDFIFVDGSTLYKLSGLYDYGYQKINITVSDTFGVIPLSLVENIEANAIWNSAPVEEQDPNVVYDGDTNTRLRYAYNVNEGYLTFTFTEPTLISAVRFLAEPPNETHQMRVSWSDDNRTWTPVANGYKAYSKRNWGNEWFGYNFGESITAKYFRIEMKTFVTAVRMYEVEWYGTSLSIEEEPVEQFEINYVDATSTQDANDYTVLTDNNPTTGKSYGYLDSKKIIKIYAKQKAKIGKIRTYHSRLDNPNWIKISIFTSYLNGSLVEVVPQTEYLADKENQWIEWDLSANQYTGVMIQITTGIGSISTDILAGLEVDPW